MARSQHVEGTEDRLASYRRWRYGFGGGCYVSDIDQVEYRIREGEPVPVALLELTRIDHVPTKAGRAAYRAKIVERYEHGFQGQVALATAERMGCHVFIVAYPRSLDWFWLYDLTAGGDWWPLSREEYEAWIRELGR